MTPASLAPFGVGSCSPPRAARPRPVPTAEPLLRAGQLPLAGLRRLYAFLAIQLARAFYWPADVHQGFLPPVRRACAGREACAQGLGCSRQAARALPSPAPALLTCGPCSAPLCEQDPSLSPAVEVSGAKLPAEVGDVAPIVSLTPACVDAMLDDPQWDAAQVCACLCVCCFRGKGEEAE